MLILSKDFVPTVKIEKDKSNAKVGEKIKVTVTTSADVAAVEVNGFMITNYLVIETNRVWEITLVADNVGNMSINTTVYDADGRAEIQPQQFVDVKDQAAVVANNIRNLVTRAVSLLKSLLK